MTTLVYVKDTMPPQFKSLGSPVFPKGKIYTLGGKFPLESYLDLYVNSGIPHTLNGIPVKLSGYDLSCRAGCVNQYTACKINVMTMSPTKKYKARNKTRRRIN
jgi:hypothetical protein